LDIEKLTARASLIRGIRDFFSGRGYLELDTPALSSTLIPETCLEVFKTELLTPNERGARGTQAQSTPLYLVPSPEIYIKKIIASHKVPVFQISKCYRNGESRGAIHSPEFTMLEYYTMGASYKDSASLTQELFLHLAGLDCTQSAERALLTKPFTCITMDEAFLSFAGFKLSAAQEVSALASHARRLGIVENSNFDSWAWDDLYELILVHAVEPKLPRDKAVLLMDYPAQVPCLAKDVKNPAGMSGTPLFKERWELYVCGIELANCYSEETDPLKVKTYFEREGMLKKNSARVPHAIDPNYWKTFTGFPECSGVALGVDRLIALITGSRTLESILPFSV
jgi:lysyl-tRNA synthetase class 2